MSAEPAGRAALRQVDDDVHSLRPQLLAVGALLRLAAETKEGLDVDECRGLYELLDHVVVQAAQVERAYDALFPGPAP